jgi:hypothetical protein
MMKYTYLKKRHITSNNIILPSFRLYILISIFPHGTAQQILGSKPELCEINYTGHCLRQSQTIIIIIIIIIIIQYFLVLLWLPCTMFHPSAQ